MSKGFVWFAQNNDKTDYTELSISLAKSIKKHNAQNKVCVITDENSKFQNEYVDIVKVLKHDSSSVHDLKWANEYKVFDITPFTHTIKLEADMLWSCNTDWWWDHLWQNDLVFGVDCFDYRSRVVKDSTYRKLFLRNQLPNIYNGLMYFRKSKKAQRFFELAKIITQNWETVRSSMLIACHDKYPSTDVVYALAYRIMDPCQTELVDYDWFKFIHNKNSVHGLSNIRNHDDYLMPNRTGDSIYIGETRLNRVLHYHRKELHERIA